MTCERASDSAREALLEAKTKGRAKSSLAKVCSWMERDGSNWYDSIGDPSAGDFVGVLRALDGEIAVEVGEDLFIVYGPAGFVQYVRHDDGQVSYSPESDDGEDAEDWLWGLDLDYVRLLHRDDTQELPGAVQEAMEGEQ